MATLEQVYGLDPWDKMDKNQRSVFDPALQGVFRQNTVYTDLIPYVNQDLGAKRTTKLTMNFVFDYEIHTAPQPNMRYNEVEPAYLDSKQVEIGIERHQWMTAVDKYDQMVTYWTEGGAAGIMPVVRNRIGVQMTGTFNRLIRNAFLSTVGYMGLPNNSYTGADQITASDIFTVDMIDDAILRGQTQNMMSPIGPLPAGSLLCVGTPGQHYDVIRSNDPNNRWVKFSQYNSQGIERFNSYDIGAYHSSRHLATNENILWNCGKTTTQTDITAAAGEADGAPDPATTKVDGVYMVGQTTSSVVHYVTVASTAGFNVGDLVTIHTQKNQAADVTANPKIRVLGAPKFDGDPFITRTIVKIVDGTKLAFDQPLQVNFKTEVATSGTGVATPSSGCYGFVTKGLSLHVNVMIAQPYGVVAGVLQPPKFYAPAPIDTHQSVYRYGWDAYLKYQLFRPEAFEVFVTAGTYRNRTVKAN